MSTTRISFSLFDPVLVRPAIVESFAPVFPLQNLKPGQQVRFNLVPAPGDTDQMEPVKVSVYAGDKHIASVARNNRGDFIVTDQKGGLTAEGAEQQQRATLYASFYHAAQSQRIPADTILKLLDSPALTPASRAVLVLHFREEMPLAHVAAILEIPLGTVKSRLAFGLKTLRKEFGDGTRT